MDVVDGPLERARKHIKQHKLEDRITVRKSNGLQKLEKRRGTYCSNCRYGRWSCHKNITRKNGHCKNSKRICPISTIRNSTSTKIFYKRMDFPLKKNK